jgi:hypothetical protein
MADGDGNGNGTNGIELADDKQVVAQLHDLEFRAMASIMLDRMQFARQAGISFGGLRDMYQVLGYAKTLTFRMMYDRYARGGIAKRIVEAYPKATWRGGVTLFEDEDPKVSTSFEQAWEALQNRLNIWSVLQRVDILAGLSTYSVLLIGAPGDLSTPLPKAQGPDQLLYLTPFSGGGGPGGSATHNSGSMSRIVALDADCTIYDFETDITNPRFGMPNSYQLKRVDLATPALQRPVHYTRIIHVAEGILGDEVYGTPTLENVWNLLDDLDKVTGGGAEAFWLRANQGIHMDIAKDMTIPKSAPGAPDPLAKMRADSEDYQHGITRWLRTKGVTVTPLGSDVADFKNPTDAILTQIAGSKGIPKRLLLGSEMGQLASGQDADNWDTQVMDRRTSYAGPMIVRRLVDRLIEFGYLPKPAQYEVEWPVIQNLTEIEKAAGAKAMADVNASAKMTVFDSDEMREKWYGLEPGKDDPTETYKAEGAKAWAMVNKTMGVTVFTDDEIRRVWYDFAPLRPDEKVPINAPEKIAATKAPGQVSDLELDDSTDAPAVPVDMPPRVMAATLHALEAAIEANDLDAVDEILGITTLGGPGSGPQSSGTPSDPKTETREHGTVVAKSKYGNVEIVKSEGRPIRYIGRRKNGESVGTYNSVHNAQQALRGPKNPESFTSGYLHPQVDWKHL